MDTITQYRIRKGASNLFGVLGYLVLTLEWVWILIIYFSLFKDFMTLVGPDLSNKVESTPIVINDGFQPILIALSIMIVITMIALTVYVIVKIPPTIARAGKKIVHKTAEAATPFVIKAIHKKETKKFHIKISYRLAMILKIVFVSLPIILTFMYQTLREQPVDFLIVQIVGLGLVGLALVLFSVQYLLAYLLQVKPEEVW